MFDTLQPCLELIELRKQVSLVLATALHRAVKAFNAAADLAYRSLQRRMNLIHFDK
jgi:hypothetical protein